MIMISRKGPRANPERAGQRPGEDFAGLCFFQETTKILMRIVSQYDASGPAVVMSGAGSPLPEVAGGSVLVRADVGLPPATGESAGGQGWADVHRPEGRFASNRVGSAVGRGNRVNPWVRPLALEPAHGGGPNAFGGANPWISPPGSEMISGCGPNIPGGAAPWVCPSVSELDSALSRSPVPEPGSVTAEISPLPDFPLTQKSVPVSEPISAPSKDSFPSDPEVLSIRSPFPDPQLILAPGSRSLVPGQGSRCSGYF